MQITNEESGGVRISGSLIISVANDLRTARLEALAANSILVLDLSEVDACDVAGIQVIYSAQRTARACNKSLRIASISTAILAAGTALGLPLDELTELSGTGIPEHLTGTAARGGRARDGV